MGPWLFSSQSRVSLYATRLVGWEVCCGSTRLGLLLRRPPLRAGDMGEIYKQQEAGSRKQGSRKRKQEAGNRKQGMNETVENPEGPVASAPGPHSFPVSCFLSPASCLLFSWWLRPRLVSLVELRVPVVKLLTLALHEHFLNAGPNVDWITRRHDHVGDLADLDRTVVLVDPEHARRVDRDRLQRLFRIEAIGHGQADLVRQVAGATRSASCPRNLHAGLLEHARIREHQVIRIIVPRDRKSTRLNSSHLVISYAVFCLKKKKHLYR